MTNQMKLCFAGVLRTSAMHNTTMAQIPNLYFLKERCPYPILLRCQKSKTSATNFDKESLQLGSIKRKGGISVYFGTVRKNGSVLAAIIIATVVILIFPLFKFKCKSIDLPNFPLVFNWSVRFHIK